jgi:nucleotide-binding universal stress UspA family protein
MVAIQRILCPVDFSDASQHAIEHAIAMARWSNASISALHVLSPAFMPVSSLPPLAGPGPDDDLTRLRAETAACFETAGAEGVRVDVLVDVGQPARHILDRAETLPADMIVMGTHGASGFEHLVLGSVTEKVLRKARCPVLTVPPRTHAVSKLPFRHLLCPVDFSDSSLEALELALALAAGSSSMLTLLHVIEWPWEEPPPPVSSELPPEQAAALAEYRRYVEKSAMARLDTLTPHEAQNRCDVARRVVHGKSHVQILRVATEVDADLIVMGVHGRNVADVMLFGSTTNQVVRRAACPVLTLRR